MTAPDLSQYELLERANAAGGKPVLSFYCDQCGGDSIALARVRDTPFGHLYEARQERRPTGEARKLIGGAASRQFMPMLLLEQVVGATLPLQLHCRTHGDADVDVLAVWGDPNRISRRVRVRCHPPR